MSNCGSCDIYGPLRCPQHHPAYATSSNGARPEPFYWGESWRLYRCTNELCPTVGAELRVQPERRGPFLAWPEFTCVCGMAPEIAEWRTPYGRSTRLEGSPCGGPGHCTYPGHIRVRRG